MKYGRGGPAFFPLNQSIDMVCLKPTKTEKRRVSSRHCLPVSTCLKALSQVRSHPLMIAKSWTGNTPKPKPIGSMVLVYVNIWGILMVNVTIYIAAPWILWVSCFQLLPGILPDLSRSGENTSSLTIQKKSRKIPSGNLLHSYWKWPFIP